MGCLHPQNTIVPYSAEGGLLEWCLECGAIRFLPGGKWTEPEPSAWASQDDKPLPEDEEIDKVFPTRSKRHDLYREAMRLVGAKYTKGGLVALVNWLLHEREKSTKPVVKSRKDCPRCEGRCSITSDEPYMMMQGETCWECKGSGKVG